MKILQTKESFTGVYASDEKLLGANIFPNISHLTTTSSQQMPNRHADQRQKLFLKETRYSTSKNYFAMISHYKFLGKYRMRRGILMILYRR